MARQVAGAGKHHRPGHGGHSAPQFAIDEIGQPPEEQADRREGAAKIGHRQQAQFLAAAKQPDRDDHPQQSAMEGHAAFPGGDQLDGVADKRHRHAAAEIGIGRDAAQDGAIDEVPAQPTPQDDSESRPFPC